jgi:hypothetical protein
MASSQVTSAVQLSLGGIVIVAALIAFLAVPEPAQASVQTPQASIARRVKEKKICIVDPATTGSLMRSKICKTKAEWDALAARDRGAGNADHISAPTNAGNSD